MIALCTRRNVNLSCERGSVGIRRVWFSKRQIPLMAGVFVQRAPHFFNIRFTVILVEFSICVNFKDPRIGV